MLHSGLFCSCDFGGSVAQYLFRNGVCWMWFEKWFGKFSIFARWMNFYIFSTAISSQSLAPWVVQWKGQRFAFRQCSKPRDQAKHGEEFLRQGMFHSTLQIIIQCLTKHARSEWKIQLSCRLFRLFANFEILCWSVQTRPSFPHAKICIFFPSAENHRWSILIIFCFIFAHSPRDWSKSLLATLTRFAIVIFFGCEAGHNLVCSSFLSCQYPRCSLLMRLLLSLFEEFLYLCNLLNTMERGN